MVFAGIAVLNVGQAGLFFHFQHLAVEPVPSVGSGDEIEHTFAVGQAHLDDFVNHKIGFFFEGDFIENKEIVIVPQEVLPPPLGGAGFDDGAVAENQVRVGSLGHFGYQPIRFAVTSEYPHHGIEDDAGLVLGDTGGDDMVLAGLVVLRVADHEESMMDDLDRFRERFPPAVAGHQQIFTPIAVL